MWQCDDVCYMSEDLAKMHCHLFSVLRVCESFSEMTELYVALIYGWSCSILYGTPHELPVVLQCP